MQTILELWEALFLPLLRLLTGMAIGLLIANILEALNWTKYLAKVAKPLANIAHLQEIAAASFSMAFVSPASANALLAKSYEECTLRRREIVLANLFNSLPSYLTHTPTIFFLVYPAIGFPAFIYVGLTLLAALGRTVFTVIIAHTILPIPKQSCNISDNKNAGFSWQDALQKALKRFKKRIPKLLYFTVPIYILMYILLKQGFFDIVEVWLSEHLAWLSFLRPEAMGIIALYLAAELGAALGAAGSVLQSANISEKEIVLALLVGNILSTPMRAIRHQFPSYAGFFSPKLAIQLIISNQGLRALSMIIVTSWYYYQF